MGTDYRILDHTADLRIEVQGTDSKNLFENAAMALMDLMIGGTTSEMASPTEVSVSGRDLSELLVRWLGEILYLFAGEQRVATSADIRNLTSHRVEAIVEAAPFDPRSHSIRTEVKAITYHQAEVVRTGNRWVARVIFDV